MREKLSKQLSGFRKALRNTALVASWIFARKY